MRVLFAGFLVAQPPQSQHYTRATGIPVKIIENEKYGGSIYEVFNHRRYLKNKHGAPCTNQLKKEMRRSYQRPDDIQVFGYTTDELDRANRFIDANNEVNEDFILIEAGISKKACFTQLAALGIKRGLMYELGYQNNNCIGCIKGGMGYWNKIRVDFPIAFQNMAALERKLNFSVNKDDNGSVFLDELDQKRGRFIQDSPGDCGFTCEVKPV